MSAEDRSRSPVIRRKHYKTRPRSILQLSAIPQHSQKQSMFPRLRPAAAHAPRNVPRQLTRQAPSRPPVRPSPILRQLHTTPPRQAKYERFDTGRSGPTGPSGRPDVWSFFRRRFGSDRAVWLYGIGIGGGGIYYVTQYVSSTRLDPPRS